MIRQTRLRFVLAALLAVVALVATQAPPVRAGIVLEASTDSLEIVTTTTAAIDYDCSWADQTTTAFTPGKSAGQITTATTTTVVAAPASSTQRDIMECTFTNGSTTTANVLTVQRDVSATNRVKLPQVTLAPKEVLLYSTADGWQVKTASGLTRVQGFVEPGYHGRNFGYAKTATALDAAGYWIWLSKDAGFPGASVPGSPGVNGWTTDCSVASNAADPAGATQLGSHVLTDPSTGNLYLTQASFAAAGTGILQLIDVLWYNTGLTVTTTTEQAFTTPTLPARDINGSTNGEDVQLAIVCTTACTNAGVITNTTADYTDESGNASTATFFAAVGWQAPATPVIGTFMKFALAAGDRGVRAITSASGGGITLGTSYGGGAISAVLYRVLLTVPAPVANVAVDVNLPAPGIRVYPNSCLSTIWTGPATTAPILMGSYTIEEK
jgi:hypothetical protein